jgi:UDP-glucose 4-epimerase
MKILITGGAGYIGSHTIVEILEHTDWTPISLDSFVNSEPETFDRIKSITGKEVRNYKVDLKSKEECRKVFEENKFAGILHFAALKAVGESVEKPLHYYQNNVQGLINLVDLQLEFGIPNQIYSSSCTVYGAAKELPVSESTPSGQAESPYGWTKVMGEQILRDISSASDTLKVLALRYFNPVGAHSSGKLGELPKGVPNNLLPYITQTAAGIRGKLTIHGDDYETRDGTCIRDYIHVSDIASAHVAAMKHLIEGKQNEPFDFINLGSGIGVTVKEAVDAFIKVNQVELNFVMGPKRAGDVAAIYADNTKAHSVLGWQAKRDLDEMMRSAWKWQQELNRQSL